MVSKDNIMGLMAVLAGMLIFKATSNISVVENFIRDKPYIVIAIGFGLFFYRKKIAEKLGGK